MGHYEMKLKVSYCASFTGVCYRFTIWSMLYQTTKFFFLYRQHLVTSNRAMSRTHTHTRATHQSQCYSEERAIGDHCWDLKMDLRKRSKWGEARRWDTFTCLVWTSCLRTLREYRRSKLLLPLVDRFMFWDWRLLLMKLHWFPMSNDTEKCVCQISNLLIIYGSDDMRENME